MKIKIDNYTFNKTAKTITFTDYVTIQLDCILGVINTTRGVILFTPVDVTKGGTVSTNVLTLTYDTSAMNNADELVIYYYDSNASLKVQVVNQIDLTTVQTTLANILTKVTAIDVNTDTIESKLTDVLNEIDANGTVNHNDLLNVITELQGIDANTDTLEASLTSIISNTTGNATSAKQDITNTALGAPSDAVASSDTGSFSIIAFIKRGLQNWSTFLSRFPASLGTRGGLRVESPDQVNFAYSQAGIIAINTDLLIIDCAGLSSLSIQCTSMGTAGVVTPAWSNDGTNFPASLTIMTPSGSSPATITGAGIWTTQIYGRYLRLRLTTATTAGTTTFSVQGLFGVNNLSYPTQVISGAVTLTSTTLTSISAGTNLIADVGLQVRANATGAPTAVAINSPATPIAQVIKAGAGRVCHISVSNSNASPRWLKVFNATTATMGTTSALYEVMIPANNVPREISIPLAVGHGTGITIAVTGGAGPTNNTAITGGEITGFITFA